MPSPSPSVRPALSRPLWSDACIPVAWLLAVTAAATASVLGSTAVSAAANDPVTVTQNLLPGLAAATDLGAADATAAMTLVVNLARPNPSGEQALLDAENDPSSPSYRQYLSPDDFATRFGVAQSQLAALTSWLSGGGLTVDSVSAARDVIAVRGTVAQVSSLFATPIHRFSYSGAQFLANTGAPVIPLALGITNVVG
jgi:pseudomonalisin